MSKTGDKIDYSLRLQKNIERKIFGDVVRTLSFFEPIENYRYIGFGSFYYKDFLMFYEDFNIQKGISIEIDSDSYVKKVNIVENIIHFFLTNVENTKNNIIDEILTSFGENAFRLNSENIRDISEYVAQIITNMVLEKLKKMSEVAFSKMNLLGNREIYYRSFPDVADQLKIRLISNISRVLKNELENKVNMVEDVISISLSAIEISNFEKILNFNEREIDSLFYNSINNRYIYNKPYGFIDLSFGELNVAFDAINWDENQKNIIWLDYDEFIDQNQLLGLEKSVSNSSRGDLIIFSTSMGTNPEARYNSFKEIRDNSHRFIGKLRKADCDDKFVFMPIRKMVSNTVKAAIANKNRNRPTGTPVYKATEVLECTYSDGTPMYTYGIVIHYKRDNEMDERFPTNLLKEKIWFPKEDKCYRIYIPALTHKEVTAINQLLPIENVETICKRFPYIPKQTVKKYVEIWQYYPRIFEVGNYV